MVQVYSTMYILFGIVFVICHYSAVNAEIEELDPNFPNTSINCYPDALTSDVSLLLVLDCSPSVNDATWKDSVAFAKNLTEDTYRKYANRTAIGVVYFSTNAYMDVKLNLSKVANLANIHKALDTPRCRIDHLSKIQSSSGWNFDETEPRKVTAVVITNGLPSFENASSSFGYASDFTPMNIIDDVVAYSLKSIRYSDVEVYAVGVGDNVDKKHLEHLPTKPGSTFMLREFANPRWLSNVLVQKIPQYNLTFTPEYGPKIGGTFIYITVPGPCIARATTVHCRFGFLETTAIPITVYQRPIPNYIVCITPPAIIEALPDTFDDQDEDSSMFWQPNSVDFSVVIQYQNAQENLTLGGSETPFYFIEPPLAPSNKLHLTLPTQVNGHLARAQWVKNVHDMQREVDINFIRFDNDLGEIFEQPIATKVNNTGDWIGIAQEAVTQFSGLYTIQIRQPISNVIEMAQNNTVSNTQGPPYWTGLRLSYDPGDCGWEKATNEQQCAQWLGAERAVLWLESLRNISCPPTSFCAVNDRENFYPDPYCCNPKIDPRCGMSSFLQLESDHVSKCHYNPGADHCYYSRPVGSNGSQQQCCYKKNVTSQRFELVTERGYGAGRANKWSDLISHFFEDIRPWTWCCEGRLESQNCRQFSEKRPTRSSEGYDGCKATQGVGFGFGDPHFVTLDNLQYTFNGRGEFILVRSIAGTTDTKFEIQVRLEKMRGIEKATWTTGLSVAYGCTTSSFEKGVTVTVYGTEEEQDVGGRGGGSETNFAVFINKEFLLNDGKLIQDHWFLCQKKKQKVSVILGASGVIIDGPGVSLTLQVGRSVISYFLEIQHTFQGKLEGLLGNWNGRIDDDLKPNKKNSSPLPVTTDLETIHNKFGLTWNVLQERSLFDYFGDPREFQRINDHNYRPAFGVEKMDAEFAAKVDEVCGDSFACRFDASVTKDIELAARTLAAEEQAREIAPNITVIDTPRFTTTSSGSSGFTHPSEWTDAGESTTDASQTPCPTCPPGGGVTTIGPHLQLLILFCITAAISTLYER